MTMFETLNPLATTVFGIGCFGAGAIAVLALRLRRRDSRRHLSDYTLNLDLDSQLGGAARRWSAEHGRPDAAGLLHHRLRTLAKAETRRSERRWLK